MTAQNEKIQLVVYTVLLGKKEALGSPLSTLETDDTDLDIHYVCFSDNPDLKSDTWEMVLVDNSYLPPDKFSRRVKALPYEYFPEYQYSLYIDNIVTFKRLPSSKDLHTENEYLFKIFLHAFRENLVQEADAIAMLGYDDVNVIDNQLAFYDSKTSLDNIKPIHTNTVILREHHHEKVKQHGIIWWENILCFSKRDQMSFDFAVNRSGVNITPFPGFKHENDFVHAINNANDNRIKANFDEIKYAWRHRDDSKAWENPRDHFLSSPQAAGEDYAKRNQFFQHICNRFKSSLGNSIAPRREIAEILNDILRPYRAEQNHSLLVRIVDKENNHSFSSQEFSAACQALSTYFNMTSFNTLDLDHVDIKKEDQFFNRPDKLFHLTFIFGLCPDAFFEAFETISPLVDTQKGILVFLLTHTGNLAIIEKTRLAIEKRFNKNCMASISHSRHDSNDYILPNSLVFYEWR